MLALGLERFRDPGPNSGREIERLKLHQQISWTREQHHAETEAPDDERSESRSSWLPCAVRPLSAEYSREACAIAACPDLRIDVDRAANFMMPIVREYRADDRTAIARICEETVFRRPPEDCTTLLSALSVLPYCDLAPQLAMVLEDDGEVTGYACGCADVRDFVRRYRDEYSELLATAWLTGQ